MLTTVIINHTKLYKNLETLLDKTIKIVLNKPRNKQVLSLILKFKIKHFFIFLGETHENP